MQERKCFVCGRFGHIAWHCENRREIEKNRREEVRRPECWPSNNKFEVLISRVIQVEIPNKGKKKKEKLL